MWGEPSRSAIGTEWPIEATLWRSRPEPRPESTLEHESDLDAPR